MKVITMNQALEAFIDTRGGRGSKRTRDLYRERLTSFVNSYGGKSDISKLTRKDVLKWLDKLTAKGYAAASMAGFRGDLKVFVRFCIRRRWITFEFEEDSPIYNIKTGSKMAKRRRVVSNDSLAAAEKVAVDWMQNSYERREVRDGLIFCISLRCGARSAEIQRLKLSEVSKALEAGANEEGIYLIQSSGKSEDTVMRLTEHEVEGVRRWLLFRPKKANIDRLFVPSRRSRTSEDRRLRWREISRSSLADVYVNVCKAAGVRPILSHALRHHVGDDLARLGCNAAQIGHVLNHSDANSGATTAFKYYIQTDEAQVSSAVAKRLTIHQRASVTREQLSSIQ